MPCVEPDTRTCTGLSRSVVVPSPSRPPLKPPPPLAPQQRTVPPVSSAQVCSTPADTCCTPVRTCTGFRRFVVVPSPSCPSTFRPQHRRVASRRSAQVCRLPAEICVTSSSTLLPCVEPDARTCTGLSRPASRVVPSPSCPPPLRPQHRTVPSASRAQENSSFAAEICGVVPLARAGPIGAATAASSRITRRKVVMRGSISPGPLLLVVQGITQGRNLGLTPHTGDLSRRTSFAPVRQDAQTPALARAELLCLPTSICPRLEA